jgi:hypothetical protein
LKTLIRKRTNKEKTEENKKKRRKEKEKKKEEEEKENKSVWEGGGKIRCNTTYLLYTSPVSC